MMEDICFTLRDDYFNVFYTLAAMKQIVVTTYIINSYTPKCTYIYVQGPLSKDYSKKRGKGKTKTRDIILFYTPQPKHSF